MQKTLQTKPESAFRRALKHPFAGFIFIGILLLSLQVLSIMGADFVKSSMLNGFASVMVYSIVGYGFTFLLGYAGLASLGTAGFVGLGAYIAGYLIREQPQVPYLGVILAAMLVSVVLGLAVGFISLRIEGIFLAIVTLGLSEIFYQIFNNWLGFTNGSMGSSISKYPIFQLFQNPDNWLAAIDRNLFAKLTEVPFLQAIFDMKTIDARRSFYILLVLITVGLMMLTYNLGKSSTGRAMLAMKNSSSAAQAMGISLLKYRLLAFLMSTIFAGFAGVMFMSYFKFSTPTNYTIIFSLNILAAVLIGGSKNLIGTFLGCLVVFGLTPIFLQDIPFFRDNSWVINVTIGSIIILIVMFYPGGLMQFAANVKNSLVRIFRHRAAPNPTAALTKPAETSAAQDNEAKRQARSHNREMLALKLNNKSDRLKTHRSAPQTASLDLPEDVCLRLSGLSMVFGGLKAVDDLSFDVKQGEIFGLIGPNGAGKTTVFNCITQFYKPTQGDILFRNKDGELLRLNQYQVHNIITKGIVRTFQNVEVIGELSILENLLIASHARYRANLLKQFFNTPDVRREENALRERALSVLEYCGLLAVKDLPPVGQPYGVLKRVELARTLMADASLIILDEPAAGLNDQETLELIELIRDIQRDFKATIFLVEHNMGLVMNLCDHICAISFGKKLAYGTPAQIQSDAMVQEAYLGTSDKHELEAV